MQRAQRRCSRFSNKNIGPVVSHVIQQKGWTVRTRPLSPFGLYGEKNYRGSRFSTRRLLWVLPALPERTTHLLAAGSSLLAIAFEAKGVTVHHIPFIAPVISPVIAIKVKPWVDFERTICG
jgi:hypothetical protein